MFIAIPTICQKPKLTAKPTLRRTLLQVDGWLQHPPLTLKILHVGLQQAAKHEKWGKVGKWEREPSDGALWFAYRLCEGCCKKSDDEGGCQKLHLWLASVCGEWKPQRKTWSLTANRTQDTVRGWFIVYSHQNPTTPSNVIYLLKAHELENSCIQNLKQIEVKQTKDLLRLCSCGSDLWLSRTSLKVSLYWCLYIRCLGREAGLSLHSRGGAQEVVKLWQRLLHDFFFAR